MIFRQWEEVLNGTKTQTRRIIKPNHHQTPLGDHAMIVKTAYESRGELRTRTLWVVGKSYAVQPPGEPGSEKRGEKSVGRIRIKSIRRELLQDMSDGDLIKEGFACYEDIGAAVLDEVEADRETFKETWDDMYKDSPGYKWDDNPGVWVIDFELEYVE